MAKNKDNSIPDDMDAQLLLKEADEALHNDKMHALWAEWGSTIIGMALMVIFGTMIGVGWQNWRASVHASQTSALISAQSNASVKNDDLDGSYKGIAALMNAGKIATVTQTDTAPLMIGLMQQAADAGLPKEWDILAQWGELRAQADLEEDKQSAIADKMEKLANKRNNPYAPLLLMESAILKVNSGDKDKAIALLTQAQDHELTQNNSPLQTQINNFLNLYRDGE